MQLIDEDISSSFAAGNVSQFFRSFDDDKVYRTHLVKLDHRSKMDLENGSVGREGVWGGGLNGL